jgi:hypothetical protein
VLLGLVRYGLPLLIAGVGVALIVLGDDTARGAGIVLIGVAVLVSLLNSFFRLSARGEEDRRREAEAREHFGRTGRWPDE